MRAPPNQGGRVLIKGQDKDPGDVKILVKTECKPLDKGLFFAHRDTFMNLRGAGGACWCYLLSMRVPFLLPILRLGVPDAGLGRPGGVEKCKWRGPHESRVNNA